MAFQITSRFYKRFTFQAAFPKSLPPDGQKLRYWRNPSPKFELVRKDVSGGTQRVVARQVTDFIVEPTVNNIKVTLIIKNNEAPLVAVGQAIKM